MSLSIGSGVKWNSVSQFVKVLIQLVGILVLTKILSPDDYGLMALASAVTVFANLIRDMGTGAAIIQSEKITDEVVVSIFWLNVLIGTFLSGIVFCFAPFLSSLMRNDDLVVVLQALSPVFIFSSLGVLGKSLLERELRFKTVSIIEITASILGLLVALFLAAKGFRVFSLVWMSLVNVSISAIFYLIFLDGRGFGVPALKNLKSVFSFSRDVFFFNVVNYFHRNSDTFVIGRYLGGQDLGVYNIAYKIFLFPLQNVTFVITRSMFPVYSRYQNDLKALSAHYLATVRIIALITGLFMVVMILLKKEIVFIMLGPEWYQVADVLGWLAPVGLIQSIVSTSGAVFTSVGRANILRNMGFIGVPFFVLSFIIGLRWGISGVAASYFMANLLWIFPVMLMVARVISVSILDILYSISVPVFISLVILATGYMLRLLLEGYLDSPIVLLITMLCLLMVICTVFVSIFMQDLLNKLICRFSSR